MVSFDKSDFFDYESNDDGSESGSTGTCAFHFCFDEYFGCVRDYVGCVDDSVGCVSGVGSGVFFLTGIKSIGDVVTLVVSVPKGVDSNGGGLIEIFWRPKS